MVVSFCVDKMYYEKNGGENAFMHKYLYNIHHIEANLESRDEMVCGLPTIIRLQIK